jgi:hypothetical protein
MAMTNWLPIVALAAAWPSTSLGQPRGRPIPPARPAESTGFFVEVDASGQGIEGDFDGATVLQGADDAFRVPDLSIGFGFSVKAGYRLGHFSLSLGYSRTWHDAKFVGARGDATYQAVALDFRAFLLTGRKVEPYLQVGWMPWGPLRVKDAAEVVASGEVSDAIFTSDLFTSWSLGAGASVRLRDHLSATGAVIYRFQDFRSAENSDRNDPLTISGGLAGWALGLDLGLAYTF